MAERVFAGFVLGVTIAYGIIAFAVIKAPFQYDPLGPETWPRLLAVVMGPCCLYLMVRPDRTGFGLSWDVWRRLAAVVVLLVFYAAAFQPLGFVVSTFAFCTVLSRLLGAHFLQAVVFGAASAVIGFGVCVWILDLNLPAGPFRVLM